MTRRRSDLIKVSDSSGRPIDAVYMGLNRSFNGTRVHWVRISKKGAKVPQDVRQSPSAATRAPYLKLFNHNWYLLESRLLP